MSFFRNRNNHPSPLDSSIVYIRKLRDQLASTRGAHSGTMVYLTPKLSDIFGVRLCIKGFYNCPRKDTFSCLGHGIPARARSLKSDMIRN